MTTGSVAARVPVARHGLRAAFIGTVSLVFLIVVIVGGIVSWPTRSASFAPSPVALADIPADYLVRYQQAAARGIDWAVLAAIGKIECDHGRLQAPGCNPPGTINGAGATGPMQFLGSARRDFSDDRSWNRAAHEQDREGTRQTEMVTASPTSGILPTRSRSRPSSASQWRAVRVPPRDLRVQPRGLVRRCRPREGEGVPRCLRTWRLGRRPRRSHLGRGARRPLYVQPGPPTDRGGSIQSMQGREPTGSTCDCSMFVRWAMAQAGLDVGLTTSTQWTANGRLPAGDSSQDTAVVSRGVGHAPGGYRPGDLVFFGVDDGPTGHVALSLGNGQIVHCSSSGGGSSIRPLAGYVAPTGWLRWKAVSG